MSERGYEGLDEALVPLHRHLALLLPGLRDEVGPADAGDLRIDELTVSMPIELDVLEEVGGGLSLGSSPPLYYVETSFEAAPHRLRVTIVEESRLQPEGRSW